MEQTLIKHERLARQVDHLIEIDRHENSPERSRCLALTRDRFDPPRDTTHGA